MEHDGPAPGAEGSPASADVAGIAEKVAWAAIVAVMVLAPLVSSNFTLFGLARYPLTHDQIELPRAVLLSAAAWLSVGAWALSGWLRGCRVRVHGALAALAAFLTFAGISAGLSHYPFVAFFGAYRHYEGLLQYFAYAALAFVAMQLATEKRLVWLARLVTLSGLLLAVYGIEHVLMADPFNWLTDVIAGRAFATWGNPDFFGGYLIFPIAFSIAVAVADEDGWWRLVGAFAAVASSWALVATATRGAWFAGVCVVVILIVAMARKGYRWERGALGAAAAALLGVVWVNLVSKGLLVERTVHSLSPGDSGLAARRIIWAYTWQLVLTNPVFGSGPDTMVPAATRAFGATFANDAHNYLLQLLVGDGVMGALAFFVFAGWCIVAASGVAFSPKRGGARFVLVAAWAASVGYLVHLLAGISIVTSTAMLWICLGLLMGVSARSERSIPEPALRIAFAIACLFFVCGLLLGGRALQADHAYMQARIAAHEGRRGAREAGEAVRLNPFNSTYEGELRGSQ